MRKYQKAIIIAAVVIIVLGFCGVCVAMVSLLYYLIENPSGPFSLLSALAAARMG